MFSYTYDLSCTMKRDKTTLLTVDVSRNKIAEESVAYRKPHAAFASVDPASRASRDNVQCAIISRCWQNPALRHSARPMRVSSLDRSDALRHRPLLPLIILSASMRRLSQCIEQCSIATINSHAIRYTSWIDMLRSCWKVLQRVDELLLASELYHDEFFYCKPGLHNRWPSSHARLSRLFHFLRS